MRINPGLQVLSLVEGAIQIGTGHRARWITGLDEVEQRFVLSLCSKAPQEPAGPPAGLSSERRQAILSVLRPVLIEADAVPSEHADPAPALPAASVEADVEAASASPSPSALTQATGSPAESAAVSSVGSRTAKHPPRPATRAVQTAGPGDSSLTPDVLQWSAAYELDATAVVGKRADARVAIHGLGRTGQLLAEILASAGVGSLLLCDNLRMRAEDLGAATTGIGSLGQWRTRALGRALIRAHPRLTVAETALRAPGAAPVDLAVVIAGSLLPPLEDIPEDLALLPVLFTDAGVRIGPMVIPGYTMCEACAWEQCDPTLRIVAPGEHFGHRDPVKPEASLAATAAGTVAMQILMALDRINVPAAADAMIVCDLSTGATSQVPARRRPGCTCLGQQAA